MNEASCIIKIGNKFLVNFNLKKKNTEENQDLNNEEIDVNA